MELSTYIYPLLLKLQNIKCTADFCSDKIRLSRGKVDWKLRTLLVKMAEKLSIYKHYPSKMDFTY